MPKSVADVDGFVRLIQVACEDQVVGARLESILSMPDVFLQAMGPAAERMRLELLPFIVKSLEEFPGAFAAMVGKRVEAVVIGDDPLFNANVGAVAALAATHRLPAIGITNFANAGQPWDTNSAA